MKNLLSKTGAAAALAVCLAGTSCIGPNNAYNRLNNWNSELSDSKFLNELVFLGLNIVPVYPLWYVGDRLIFNSWEFWSGSNLVDPPASDFKPQETPSDG
jgi:hypothetical protein